MEPPQALRSLSLPRFLRGPRLQVANLLVFYAVVYATIDFPNPPLKVLASVGLGAGLAAVLGRIRWGGWRVPWGVIIGTAASWLVLDGFGWLPYLLMPLVVVGSRHLLRFRDANLFNANNLGMCLLLVVGLARVGVNDWGAAPQTVLLMVLFGTVATSRVARLDLALMYLGLSVGVYYAVATSLGWGLPTVWLWALSPLQVMIGFFAVTDPATSPASNRLDKLAFALLIVLLSVPATLAGFVEAPIFALLVAAPQRHLVTDGVDRLRALVRDARATPDAAGEVP